MTPKTVECLLKYGVVPSEVIFLLKECKQNCSAYKQLEAEAEVESKCECGVPGQCFDGLISKCYSREVKLMA